LTKYNQVNKALPDRIFVYRDGVGDGQLQHVFEFEMPQFKECFLGVSSSYNPKFTFIVVTKKINTRLMVRRGGDQYANPPPGTVADTVITRPQW
jgi:aubergine-like protein